jgi:hypothetical protein
MLVELSYFYRQLCAREFKKKNDGQVGERGSSAIMQVGENIPS